MSADKKYILTISCPDHTGIVAQVSSFLADQDAFITESAHFGDPVSDRFFMRTVFTPGPYTPDAFELAKKFSRVAERFQMVWGIHDAKRKQRLLIMVSKFDHCLNDLLYRYRTGELNADIPAIVSNHPDLERLAEWHDIPFYHMPVSKENKDEQEEQVWDLIENLEIDLVVLARYMQILSPRMCERLRGRCINIHHSFLPSFKGANPYRQAHERGVKLIGATAHYVTGDLDEGPIIEQAVERVDHTYTPDKLKAVGRDIENGVLSRAVRAHVEHRVLMNGLKTVVLK
ncbi:Formyltetrahydrofolate deformylase [Candidatus Terasakiella magnetica]|uniref:Formyltetrahydrofolate deformylase n=1 Tax=Candidatus Terasakiella magnetica TaxID=1867952 RepID=A0A1C3RJY3_9PROT|nr:formyltetrahydrofolate deformylase [Candidatus Terasakiella magnetica]SCA57600.1 Formyltetrahydrofolate deformylase [Candidatus Terasakiella magnetica]